MRNMDNIVRVVEQAGILSGFLCFAVMGFAIISCLICSRDTSDFEDYRFGNVPKLPIYATGYAFISGYTEDALTALGPYITLVLQTVLIVLLAAMVAQVIKVFFNRLKDEYGME